MSSIWTAPLESLYDGLAAAKPAPAGVTAAAVSARFGIALLIKTLEITAKRASDPEVLQTWIASARRLADSLAAAANDDIVAEPARKRIEIPMQAARSAAAGLDVCAEAAGVIRGPLAADLGTAALLLRAAVQAILMCVDSNAGIFESENRRDLERKAAAQQESVLKSLRENRDSHHISPAKKFP